jgi:hypothetical protein
VFTLWTRDVTVWRKSQFFGRWGNIGLVFLSSASGDNGFISGERKRISSQLQQKSRNRLSPLRRQNYEPDHLGVAEKFTVSE